MSKKPAAPPDHIGWDLTRAARIWASEFNAQMIAAGYPQYGEARSTLFQHIAPKGTLQSTITSRSGLTKQAVQQHLDALEQDGLIERHPNPTDSRQKIICYTPAGDAMRKSATKVKKRIQSEFETKLGKDTFEHLQTALKLLLQ